MQQVDRLQRTHHDLEMRDPAVIAETDDVDAVDPDPVDLFFELEHRAIAGAPFTDIGEARTAQHLFRARQIFEGDVAAALRRVNDGAFEHRIRMKQVPERRAVMGLHVAVPSVEGGLAHRTPRFAENARSDTTGTGLETIDMHIDAYAPLCIKSRMELG